MEKNKKNEGLQSIRRLWLVLSVLLLSATAKAAIGYLVLTEQSGNITAFALADKPVITTTGGNISIATTEKEINVAIPDVRNITFTVEEPTGIAAIHTGEASFTNGTVAFTGLKVGERVAVYSTNGTLVDSVSATFDGSCTIDTNSLPRGIYIIKSPRATYKITNK